MSGLAASHRVETFRAVAASSSAPLNVKVDLAPILEAAHFEIQRAYAFMGLGTNAAEHDGLTQVHLPTAMRVQLLPKELSADHVRQIKSEFRIWIASNGFRDLVEGFSRYLDQIFEAACIMMCATGAVRASNVPQAVKRFAPKGLLDKLVLLDQEFGINTSLARFFSAFWSAQNCLSRRRGLVGEEDVSEHGRLTIKWRGFDLIAQASDGAETLIEIARRTPVRVDPGIRLIARNIDRERAFFPGEVIDFEPQELSEICWNAQVAVNEIHNSTLAYARSLGLPISAAPPGTVSGPEAPCERESEVQ